MAHIEGMAKHPKRPRDPNQLAHSIVGIATGEVSETDASAGKDAGAVARGRLGGIKGGAARAASLTPVQRSEAARKAVLARWKKA